MSNSHDLAEVADQLEQDWLKHATTAELEALEASLERPELFKSDGSITIILDPSLGGRFTVRPPEPEALKIRENVAETVFRRTRLRARLGLPRHDCVARKPNPACNCLTTTLDGLKDAESVGRDEIVTAARTIHKRRRPRHWNRSKPPANLSAQSPAAMLAGRAEVGQSLRDPSPPREAPSPRVVTETSTKRSWRPRYRGIDPRLIDPTIWLSERSRKLHGNSANILDREF